MALCGVAKLSEDARFGGVDRRLSSACETPSRAPVLGATLAQYEDLDRFPRLQRPHHRLERADQVQHLLRPDQERRLALHRVGERLDQNFERVDVLVSALLRRLADVAHAHHVLVARLGETLRPEDMDAPERHRGADRRHQAGGAAGELGQHRDHVARIGRRLRRERFCIDAADRPSQVDERVEHVQPRAGHAETRRLARIVAPAARNAGRMVVGEMPLDMQDLAERAAVHQRLQFAHRREAALVVAGAERYARLVAGLDRARGLRARQRQRLLAPHRLAGAGDRGHLLHVQRMRRRQKDRLHLRILDRVRELGGEPEAVLLREVAHLVRLLAHAMHEAQARALALHRPDERFAPAAEADDRRIDHVLLPFRAFSGKVDTGFRRKCDQI